MTEQGRVDLERMRTVHERERTAMERTAADQRARMVRAQASIDRDCHMVGRVERFRLESDEPAKPRRQRHRADPATVPAVRRGDLTAHPDGAVRAAVRGPDP